MEALRNPPFDRDGGFRKAFTHPTNLPPHVGSAVSLRGVASFPAALRLLPFHDFAFDV